MSIVSLAIVGKDNEPLFLREFNVLDYDEGAPEQVGFLGETEKVDPYGFFSADFGKDGESSLRHQVCINQALTSSL
jgi:hypothetical protein